MLLHPLPPHPQVRVGSMSDPEQLPGLAHFCEHMLFYSSEKYPVEDEYSRCVQAVELQTVPSWTESRVPGDWDF